MKKGTWLATVFVSVVTACGTAVLLSPHNADASTTQPAGIEGKMLNAIDNYKTLKGTYHIVEAPINVNQVVNFQIDETSGKSYVNITSNKNGDTVEQSFDGKSLLNFDHKANEFRKHSIKISQNMGANIPLVNVRPDGVKEYYHRPDPAFAGDAADVTFPQDYAFWIDDKNTSKEVGHEQILGRDATVIIGTLEPTFAEKHQATNFKMWVDTAIGVLLKLQEKNQSGQVTNSIDVIDIHFNEAVDNSKFNTTAPQGAVDRS